MRELFSQCTYVRVCHTQEVQNAADGLQNLRKRSQGTVEAKRASRKQEKVQKKKARCEESSQARYKLCSLFMFDSTVVVLELQGLPHAQYAYTHWRGTARAIMRMHSPSFHFGKCYEIINDLAISLVLTTFWK